MLSRRDKLLIRPWQQKRFEHHRRKVSSALPAIDDKPPLSYNHVALKLKKHQLERERTTKIEKDNLTLLRKLNHIMKTCRVDHYWTTPLPDFLNREAIYDSIKYKIAGEDIVEIRTQPVPARKSRCLACSSDYQPPKPLIPEERVPWAPAKPPVARQRSQSVPLPQLSNQDERRNDSEDSFKQQQQKKTVRIKTGKEKAVSANGGKRGGGGGGKDYENFRQSLTLSRGDFKLVVKFPSDTAVSLQDAFSEKPICGNTCSCTAMMK